MRFDRTDDVLGDRVFEIEDIIELAIELLRPDMGATVRFDQLGGDAHGPTHAPDAPFKRVADTERLGYFADIIGAVLVNEGGVAGHDRKGLEARERGCQVLDHAIGEIALLGVVAEIGKREDGDRRLAVKGAGLCRWGPSQSVAEARYGRDQLLAVRVRTNRLAQGRDR